MVLLVAWAPVGLKRLPLTLAILCVAVGVLVFSTGLLSFNPDPRTWDTATERLTELVVIISLMGAGLKLDRPLGWRRWATTWRLLAIAMPLTIVAVAWLGVAGLGFSLAMALLLGAAMAPTDPVLAADVQVGPPKSGDEDEVRFGLTSEAGLNDALAFPFVHLAILAAAGGLASTGGLTDWFTIKVGWTAAGGQYLSIRDTGAGIPAEEIPIVLSSFGRGSTALKNADEGTGLGLPIVKGLVELHGGTFTLRSEVRVGTEVIVIFPPERLMDALPQMEGDQRAA